MAEYRLHCVGESGNCYKAALMLALTGRDWEPVFVDYFGGETRTERFRREVNAMGEIPVLEHRGRRLAQSGVILDYLASETGRFGPRDDGQVELKCPPHLEAKYYEAVRDADFMPLLAQVQTVMRLDVAGS